MHDHSAKHGHGHGHGHGAPASFGRAFAIGTLLNAGFVVAETVFGFAANSVALVADAMHNLGDVFGLLLSWGALWLSQRPPSGRRTYGWGRSSILAAFANAVILLVGIGAIAWEALRRLHHPEPVGEMTVAAVAAAGILVNGGTALLFMRGRESDLNVKAAFFHMAGDAAVSLGVVAAALLTLATGWLWLDPLTSLAIVLIVGIATWSLLADSANLAMDAVPAGITPDDVRACLEAHPGVLEIHDLHIWALSTTETALTAHLVCHSGSEAAPPLGAIASELSRRFGIGHATFQVESTDGAASCSLRPETVV
jgi:cobalt-zinc-cadmium efflux system protein